MEKRVPSYILDSNVIERTVWRFLKRLNTELPYDIVRASQVAQWVKNPPAMQEMQADTSSIPRLGRSPGGGQANALQYSCLEYPMNRGAWWATVHRVTNSQTQLK